MREIETFRKITIRCSGGVEDNCYYVVDGWRLQNEEAIYLSTFAVGENSFKYGIADTISVVQYDSLNNIDTIKLHYGSNIDTSKGSIRYFAQVLDKNGNIILIWDRVLSTAIPEEYHMNMWGEENALITKCKISYDQFYVDGSNRYLKFGFSGNINRYGTSSEEIGGIPGVGLKLSDEKAPGVKSIEAAGENYYPGQVVPVKVTFTEPVDASTAVVKFNGEAAEYKAAEGSGYSNVLTFPYTVKEADNSELVIS